MKNKKWRNLYSLSGTFVCPYCLQEFPLSKATKEHEPPKSRQKWFGASRVLLACAKCNHEKGALTAAEYDIWKTTTDYHTWIRLERIRNGISKGVPR